MSSEIYSYLIEKLLKEGALDVYITPIYMKKNRPATKLTVLSKQKDIKKFTKMILKETSTFGIRHYTVSRETLDREFKELSVYGEKIKIKLGILQGKTIKCSPEYEDLKRLSEKTNIPILDLYNQVLKNFKF